MARAGDRSHHRGGPIGHRPGGSGSHSLGRCSAAAGWAGRGLREAAEQSWSLFQAAWSWLRASGAHAGLAAQFPFPRAARSPTLNQTPVTTGGCHWPKPRASWKRTRTPASFPQSETRSSRPQLVQQMVCHPAGAGAGQGQGPDVGQPQVQIRLHQASCPLQADQVTWLSPFPICVLGCTVPAGMQQCWITGHRVPVLVLARSGGLKEAQAMFGGRHRSPRPSCPHHDIPTCSQQGPHSAGSPGEASTQVLGGVLWGAWRTQRPESRKQARSQAWQGRGRNGAEPRILVRQGLSSSGWNPPWGA